MRYFILLLSPFLLFASQAITPIPEEISYNKEKALLGKTLFMDTTLSKDNSVACISCHNIYSGGADPRIVSVGYNGRKGNIQSPTVLNAVFNFRQFWNARARDLYEQASGPLMNPVEHNMTPKLVEERVAQNQNYVTQFQHLYPDGITYANVIDAIVEFEKALITPNSKFDLYLKGKEKLSPKEQQGYNLFNQYGCISCHNGVNIGGNSFAKIGIFKPYVNFRKFPDRFTITNDPFDKNVFKVPTLRNIELTAPYFHDGSQTTLKAAIQTMASYNLGIKLEEEELNAIESFLKTLTGKLPDIINE
ncbi:MAG: c-type cytochrome [Epsilonproteobacteria bacterium]|nr:c-type cytochrome [Campylobacterota bacterium]